MNERRVMTHRGFLSASLGIAFGGVVTIGACDDGAETGIPVPSGGGTESTGPSTGSGVVEACDTEGEVRACTAHHRYGCTEGIEECVDGAWSTCRLDPNPISNRALGDPSNACDGATVAANACDPNCRGFDPDSPNTGATAPDWSTGDEDDLPAGQLNPADCNQDRDCNYDSYCDEAADSGNGDCVPWAPGETDLSCNRWDITADVPCADAATPTAFQVPVCNRGSVAVPASVLNTFEVKWDTGTSMNSCSIGGSDSCPVTATEALAPGRCIEVDCPSLPDPARVYVDATGECECQNNWTYNAGSICDDVNCGESTETAATTVDVVLMVALDISGSMNDNDRIGSVRDALQSFIADADSTGIGVALRFWPDGECGVGSGASQCVATSADFVSQGACAVHPCGTSLTTGNTSGCDPTVTTVCAADPSCCGAGSPAGTCAHSPCVVGAALASGCGGDTDISTPVTNTCNTLGFQGCCGTAINTNGDWGTVDNVCATGGGDMECRDEDGDPIDCEDEDVEDDAPVNSLAYAAYEVIENFDEDCETDWNAACQAEFRIIFALYNEGRDPCEPTWDDGCVEKYADLATNPDGRCHFWSSDCQAAYDDASGGDCSACNHPSIPLGAGSLDDFVFTLDAADRTGLGGTDADEQAVWQALEDMRAGGGTPMNVAAEGAADFCRRYQTLHQAEGAICAVVLATDGSPNGCSATTASTRTAVTNAFAGAYPSSVSTFIIGIDGSSDTFMEELADLGQGNAIGSAESQAYLLSATPGVAEAQMIAALQDIRNQFNCTYNIPAGTDIDNVDVEWNGSTFDLVASSAVCAGSAGPLEFYDNGDGTVTLCPFTCADVTALAGSTVEIVAQCEVIAPPVIVEDGFDAVGACDDLPGTFPKWTFMLYDAVCPGDSSISVSAQTKLLETDATFRTLHPVVDIDSSNLTSDLANPTSLEDPLGADAYGEVINIVIDTSPSTELATAGEGPTIDYDVYLTCEYSE